MTVTGNVMQLFRQYRFTDDTLLSTHVVNQLVESLSMITGIKPNFKAGFSNPLALRDCFILMLLGCGKTVAEIAEILGYTLSTIKTYDQRLRYKLGANSRVHAFYLAVLKGYLVIL